MKKLVVIGLLFISNFLYSQSIQIINDDDFAYKSNNQSFVLFKIRVIDEVGYYTSEEIENGQYSPLFRIMKFDNVITKKWDTQISARYSIVERIKDGVWTKNENNTIYEWLYLLETNPRKSGYYFETLSLIIDRKKINIPILRKIATQNNRLYNYGTIEITINQPDRRPSYKLLNDDIEKQNIINNIKVSDPNIYNAYKDKISDEDLKFFFTITTVGEISKKSSFDYWSKLYGDGIDGQTGYGIKINSKRNGQSQQTYMSFNELTDLPANFNITYKSEWKKGEPDRPYGLILGNSDNNKYFFLHDSKWKIRDRRDF